MPIHPDRREAIRVTLCFVIQGSGGDKEVLLGLKKRGFGKGYWNGFGGKAHNGETDDDAARRELTEEIGIAASKLDPAADLLFVEPMHGEPRKIVCRAYRVTVWSGEPRESDEMRPQWFPVDRLPFDVMWPDDVYWLPHVLDGRSVRAQFQLDDHHRIIEQRVEIIPGLDRPDRM